MGDLLLAEGAVTEQEIAQWEGEIAAEISASVESADAAPLELVADLTRFVTSEPGTP